MNILSDTDWTKITRVLSKEGNSRALITCRYKTQINNILTNQKKVEYILIACFTSKQADKPKQLKISENFNLVGMSETNLGVNNYSIFLEIK